MSDERVEIPESMKRVKGFHLATLTYLEFVAGEIRQQIQNEDWKRTLLTPIERTIQILNENVLVEGLDGDNGMDVQ